MAQWFASFVCGPLVGAEAPWFGARRCYYGVGCAMTGDDHGRRRRGGRQGDSSNPGVPQDPKKRKRRVPRNGSESPASSHPGEDSLRRIRNVYGKVASQIANELLKEAETPPSGRVQRRYRKRGTHLLYGSSSLPATWTETLEEAGKATSRALEAGHNRILVELEHPKLLNRSCTVDSEFLIDACFGLCQPILDARPLRTLLMVFQTEDELKCAISSGITSRLLGRVRLGVLGQEEFVASDDMCLLVTPCNFTDDPRSIEEVEKLHYSRSWNSFVRPLILFNPRLTALSPLIEPKRRRPTFMGDYVTAYFAAPRIHGSSFHQAAVIRSFPGNWQVYVETRDSHYLIFESDEKPSLQRVVGAVLTEIQMGPLGEMIRDGEMGAYDEVVLDMLF